MRDGCVFCDYAGPSPVLAENLDDIFVIEPIRPVTPGHVLVIPRDHYTDCTDFPSFGFTISDVFLEAARWGRDVVQRDFNVITSKGIWATQTVMHFHVHVVPRHEGDGLRLPWSDWTAAL